MTTMNADTAVTLPQGDVGLLHTAAQRLLRSQQLARLAYVAADDTPGVLPMLFHWNGDEVVMAARIAIQPTWVGALDFQTRLPGVPAGSR